MKPVISVCIPFDRPLEVDFVIHTLIPLYEAKAKSDLINTLKPQFWDNYEVLELLEEANPLKSFRLWLGRFLMDNMPFLTASRNRLADTALNRGADYIYWLDIDEVQRQPYSPVDGLRILLETALREDADMVSGVYLKKEDELCVFRWDGELTESIKLSEIPPEGLEVDAVGFGCLLMNTRVLNLVEFPWFVANTDTDYPEDIGFCKRAGEAGARIWVRGDVRFGHIKKRELTVEDEV